MSLRIIFLDFDGVLNSWAFAESRKGSTWGIDPACVARVNRIIERTRADVVISSSWRIGYKRTQLCDTLREAGFVGRILGTTPVHIEHHESGEVREQGSNLIVQGYQRGHEIQAWLDGQGFGPRVREVESFVILDDEADMVNLAPWLVRTSMQTGITDDDVERAVTMLTVPRSR